MGDVQILAMAGGGWRKLGRAMSFVKNFNAFGEGLAEVMKTVKPVGDSITRAVENMPLAKLMIPLGDLIKFQEAIVIYALVSQASVAPDGSRFSLVYCRATSDGFSCRTTHGTVYGWRKMGKTGMYKFFVIVRSGKPGSQTEKFSEPTVAELLALGWRELTKIPAFRKEGLTEVKSLIVEDE